MGVERDVALLKSQVARLQAELNRRPVFNASPVGIVPPALYVILAGNTLPTWGTPGISKRTDAVAGSELPAGSGGTGIVFMPAVNPPPVSGWPLGVGVGRNMSTLALDWLLLDINSPYNGDVQADDFTPCISTYMMLDKVVGSVTYRYPCRLVLSKV